MIAGGTVVEEARGHEDHRRSRPPRSLCTSCHASTLTGAARNKAPADINFDGYAAAASQARQSAALVNSGVMPDRGSPQPSDEQKTALALWAACGTPE